MIFTPLEYEELIASIRESTEQLTIYKSWINDRPLLPDKELAVRKMEEQIQLKRKLLLKLLNMRKDDSDPH